MQFWPFLIAANQHWDYRVLLCPDFIDRKDFFSAARPVPTADGKIRSQYVTDAKFGSVRLLYKTTPVRRNGQEAYDESGRPLVRHEGIVVREFEGSHRLGEVEAKRLIQDAAKRIDEVFDAAWPAPSPPSPIPSPPQTAGSGAPSPTPPPPPVVHPTRHAIPLGRFVLYGVLAASLLANAALAWVYYQTVARVAPLEIALEERTRRLDGLNKEIARVAALEIALQERTKRLDGLDKEIVQRTQSIEQRNEQSGR